MLYWPLDTPPCTVFFIHTRGGALTITYSSIPLHELEIVITGHVSPEYRVDHSAVLMTKQLMFCALNEWIPSLWMSILNSGIGFAISWFKTVAGHIAACAHTFPQSIFNLSISMGQITLHLGA